MFKQNVIKNGNYWVRSLKYGMIRRKSEFLGPSKLLGSGSVAMLRHKP